ncbi:MAG TPA: hypothetical protein VGQ11_10000, partial [Candidatus Acidoferrales bacterium]|nr:hypothetical protein [Candidatus Acidoferrales bacterium]
SGLTTLTLTYNDGAQITVTAPSTAGGNNFGNWLGCDSVSSRSCAVLLNTDRTVTANFVSSSSISVNVQPSTTFQTWESWRATATGPYFPFQDGSARILSPSLLSQMLDDLAFDLGLNGVRLHQQHDQQIETVNDDSDAFHIRWSSFDFSRQYTIGGNAGELVDLREKVSQVIQPLKQRVQSRGVPFYVYVEPVYNISNWPAHWNTPQEYAEFAQAYVLWLRGQNQPSSGLSLTPDYWVIVNEPDGGGFSMTTIASLIPAVAARFQSMGLNIRIQTVETSKPTSATSLSTVLNAPGVSSVVGLISFHNYDYNTGQVPSFTLRNNLRSVAAQLGKRTAMTEVCCKTGWDGSYGQALGWARDVYWSMTEANVSVWEPLGMAYTCASVGCSGRTQNPISIDLNQFAYYKFANYYGLRQYSHYIRPNFVRVNATCTNCGSSSTLGQLVKPVIFRSPAGKYVAVVVNDWSTAQSIQLTGLPGGTYDITGVDSVHPRSPVTYPVQTITAGQPLSLAFPARSIVTFAQR